MWGVSGLFRRTCPSGAFSVGPRGLIGPAHTLGVLPAVLGCSSTSAGPPPVLPSLGPAGAFTISSPARHDRFLRLRFLLLHPTQKRKRRPSVGKRGMGERSRGQGPPSRLPMDWSRVGGRQTGLCPPHPESKALGAPRIDRGTSSDLPCAETISSPCPLPSHSDTWVRMSRGEERREGRGVVPNATPLCAVLGSDVARAYAPVNMASGLLMLALSPLCPSIPRAFRQALYGVGAWGDMLVWAAHAPGPSVVERSGGLDDTADDVGRSVAPGSRGVWRKRIRAGGRAHACQSSLSPTSFLFALCLHSWPFSRVLSLPPPHFSHKDVRM